jgi:exonuclease VII large subunit
MAFKLKQQLEYSEKVVLLNDPDRQLKLGYSIARIDGKIIRKVGDLKIGDNIDLKVIDGNINSQIKSIKKTI